jgi:hypothetical protein
MHEVKESPLGFGPEMFSFPYGKHIFVLARPRERDWSHYDGCTFAQGMEEWRPVMVQGHGTGQRLCAIGSNYAYSLEDFEIGPQLDIAYVMASASVPAPGR